MNEVLKAEETTGAIAAVILGENAEPGGDEGAEAEETVPHAFHNILHDKAAVAAPTYRSLTRICFWIPR